MVDVLHIANEKELSVTEYARLEALLPDVFRARLLRYRRWQDRQAGLFGKLLLRQLLIRNELPLDLLKGYQVDTYGRPSLAIPGDFNISHTEGIVIAALTTKDRIGIDVEKIRSIDPQEFTRVFTEKEVLHIGDGPQAIHRFFEVWTKKEAAMKADGRGFYLDAAQISTLNPYVQIEENKWSVASIEILNNYACHYCLPAIEGELRLSVVTRGDFS